MDALELAARHLAGWSGSGQSWHADWEEQKLGARDLPATTLGDLSPEFSDAIKKGPARGGPDALSICWRGRVTEQAGVQSRTLTRRQHAWVTAGGSVVLPRHRSHAEAAAALSFAKLPGPLAPLLLLYACEDLRQWPKVERFALACYPHPDAVGDAMQRILWRTQGRFSPMPRDHRAKQLGVRAATFRQRTRRAEAMLREWLDRAAWAFLFALMDDGTEGNPQNELSGMGERFSRDTRAACAH